MAAIAVTHNEAANTLIRTESKSQRRARTRARVRVATTRNIGDNILLRSLYGILTAVLALAGFCFFLFSAYHAFGGCGVLAALMLSVCGAWSLVRYVMSV